MKRSLLLALAAAASMSAPAYAACDIKSPTPIKIMAAAFPAWKSMTAAMQECGNVQVELDMQYRDKQPAALAAKPALYHVAGTSSNNLVTLLNDGTVRPLDELVAKFGQQLTPNQLVRIDGKIVAIAMMVNAQHLMYRSDVLEQLKIAPPTNYDEFLAAAEKIKAAGVMQYPVGGTYKAGWDLATEFVNLYFSFGGQFVAADNAPTVKGDAGQKTLALMKKLSSYMDPEFLTSDATFVAKQFQQGKVALSNFWASRAGAIDDAKESTVSGKVVMAAAASATPGGKPATTSAFYDPTIGKWVSRDPIGERGGENLYGFVSNDPADQIDENGLRPLIFQNKFADGFTANGLVNPKIVLLRGRRPMARPGRWQ